MIKIIVENKCNLKKKKKKKKLKERKRTIYVECYVMLNMIML